MCMQWFILVSPTTKCLNDGLATIYSMFCLPSLSAQIYKHWIAAPPDGLMIIKMFFDVCLMFANVCLRKPKIPCNNNNNITSTIIIINNNSNWHGNAGHISFQFIPCVYDMGIYLLLVLYEYILSLDVSCHPPFNKFTDSCIITVYNKIYTHTHNNIIIVISQ